VRRQAVLDSRSWGATAWCGKFGVPSISAGRTCLGGADMRRSARIRQITERCVLASWVAGCAAAGAATYRVYPRPVEAPTFTAPLPPADGRVLVADPAAAPSPFGWHDVDGVAGAEF